MGKLITDETYDMSFVVASMFPSEVRVWSDDAIKSDNFWCQIGRN